MQELQQLFVGNLYQVTFMLLMSPFFTSVLNFCSQRDNRYIVYKSLTHKTVSRASDFCPKPEQCMDISSCEESPSLKIKTSKQIC